MIYFKKRHIASQKMVYIAPLIAFGAMIITAGIILALYGIDPLKGLFVFFIEPLTIKRSLAELAIKATPLILCALGLALGYKAQIWNIGAEGQLTIGAIFAALIGINFADVSSFWVLPLLLISGAIGGFLYAMIPAILKYKFNCNEILTSLMLVYIAVLLLSYLITGPLKNPAAYNFPESITFSDSAVFSKLIPGTRFHAGFFIAIFAVLGMWIFTAKHIIGFQLKVLGLAPKAGKFMGIRPSLAIFTCFGITGALSGLAGAIELAGPIKQLIPTVSPGYGFAAIIVAFVGRLNPWGILLAGFILALTYIGSDNAQIAFRTPNAVGSIFQALLLFYLLSVDFLITHRVVFGKSAD